MAVHYKFKSTRDYSTIPILGNFISVANLKDKIFESKRLARGTALILANAQTYEEYLDESMLIPMHTSVVVRRIPRQTGMSIVADQNRQKSLEDKVKALQTNSNFNAVKSSVMQTPEELELDNFGDDVYAIPNELPIRSSNPVPDAPSTSETNDDTKIKVLVCAPALDWQRKTQQGLCSGKGFGSSTSGNIMDGLAYGQAGLQQKTPPQDYVCHRCHVPGHFIQHCPTKGDSTYNYRRVKPTARLVAVVNENHIISKSMCFCGATNVLADDLLPNVTLRETINSITENASSMKVQGTDSACYHSKVSSSTISLASNREKVSSPDKDGTLYAKETTNEEKVVNNAPQPSLQEGTSKSVTLNKDDVQKELASHEPGKKKKKKTCLPVNDMDKQWRTPEDLVARNCMVPLCSSVYNPHMANTPLGMRGHMAYYSGVASHWGCYAYDDLNVPVGGSIPQDSFVGQWDLLSHQRDPSEKSLSMDRSVHKVEAVQLDKRLYQYQNQDHHRNEAAAGRKRKGSELSSTTFPSQDINKKRELPPREARNPNKKRLLCSMDATNCKYDYREPTSTHSSLSFVRNLEDCKANKKETSGPSGQREYINTLDHHDWSDDDDDDDDRNFKRKSSWYRSSPTLKERAIPV